jgi:glycosyltransferase involved in cell wall biosynthesis
MNSSETTKYSVLYLTKNGLLEPLGQSQVMAYLRGLSSLYRITILSFEKTKDLSDINRVNNMKAECETLGIHWMPQRSLCLPRFLSPFWNMMQMVWLSAYALRSQRVQLVHARSYIPAAVAWLLGRLTQVPYIFDMRALWPEELITAGRLRRGSWLHRRIVEAERTCLRDAAGVISLTHAAVDHLSREYPKGFAREKVAVIPTCADLERFRPSNPPAPRLEIGCVGTVLSGWFKLDWLSDFIAVAAQQDARLQFRITTLDDPFAVWQRLDLEPSVHERLTIEACSSHRVQEVLQGQLASVMFFSRGLGKLGSSPTRLGEVLGCGVPVVTNEGVGDVAKIIREHRVGVLVQSCQPADLLAAWAELQALLLDPGLPQRCRETAERHFSLTAGTQAYADLYGRVLTRSRVDSQGTA